MFLHIPGHIDSVLFPDCPSHRFPSVCNRLARCSRRGEACGEGGGVAASHLGVGLFSLLLEGVGLRVSKELLRVGSLKSGDVVDGS